MVPINRNLSTLRHLHRRATAVSIWRVPLDHAGLRRFTVDTKKQGTVERVIRDGPSASEHHYGAIVVGGGPAGLATVGTLLDEDVKPILWIDHKFQGGRLNAQYREVPRCATSHDPLFSNSRNTILTAYQ